MPSPRRRGVSMTHIVLALSLLGVVSLIAVPFFTQGLAVNRDDTRLADIAEVQAAISAFYRENLRYPYAQESADDGGWDVSHDGDFLAELRTSGFLERLVADPINDERYHYRYYVYEPGAFGCSGDEPFYVLGIRRFETRVKADAKTGFFRCSGRNWNTEFDYVVGSPGVSR